MDESSGTNGLKDCYGTCTFHSEIVHKLTGLSTDVESNDSADSGGGFTEEDESVRSRASNVNPASASGLGGEQYSGKLIRGGGGGFDVFTASAVFNCGEFADSAGVILYNAFALGDSGCGRAIYTTLDDLGLILVVSFHEKSPSIWG